MQTIREKNTFCTHFSVIPLCQRSFRSLLKYRTIVLYLFSPSLGSFNRSIVQSFIFFIPSSVSGTTIIYFLYYYPFSIHFRDHLAIILNITIGFLSHFTWSFFYLVHSVNCLRGGDFSNCVRVRT